VRTGSTAEFFGELGSRGREPLLSKVTGNARFDVVARARTEVRGTGTVYVNATLSVLRQRAVGDGLHEELTILNHAAEPVDLSVRVDAGCDFADLFEVKDALEKGKRSARVEDGKLVLAYDRGTFRRSTAISASISASAPARIDKNGLTFTVRIGPHEEWSTRLDVVAEGLAVGRSRATIEDPKRSHARMRRNLDRWIDQAPRLECDWDPLKSTYRRSLVELAALRFSPLIAGGTQSPGGGPAVVHDHVWPGQHSHELAGASVHARACRDDAAGAR
jgi:hypothetical protein